MAALTLPARPCSSCPPGAAASHAKDNAVATGQGQDGYLTQLCDEDPSADECRVYDD